MTERANGNEKERNALSVLAVARTALPEGEPRGVSCVHPYNIAPIELLIDRKGVTMKKLRKKEKYPTDGAVWRISCCFCKPLPLGEVAREA